MSWAFSFDLYPGEEIIEDSSENKKDNKHKRQIYGTLSKINFAS
jgi:hypothetical protein